MTDKELRSQTKLQLLGILHEQEVEIDKLNVERKELIALLKELEAVLNEMEIEMEKMESNKREPAVIRKSSQNKTISAGPLLMGAAAMKFLGL